MACSLALALDLPRGFSSKKKLLINYHWNKIGNLVEVGSGQSGWDADQFYELFSDKLAMSG